MKRMPLLIAAIALALSGCSQVAGSTGFDLSEFSIDGPASLVSGAQTIDVANSGQFAHTLVVTDEDGVVVASTSLIPAGEMTALDLDLDAGRYQFTCRIVAETEDGQIIDHFEEGMNAAIDVR